MPGQAKVRAVAFNPWLLPLNLAFSWVLSLLLVHNLFGSVNPMPETLILTGVIGILIHQFVMSLAMRRMRMVVMSLAGRVSSRP